jgi:hypothetical protein
VPGVVLNQNACIENHEVSEGCTRPLARRFDTAIYRRWKSFSFYLLDLDGGEIRITCFNVVADQFNDRMEKVGEWAFQSGKDIQVADRRNEKTVLK